MIHDVLAFLQTWSPHIWLFGSIFGVLMSGTLFYRRLEQRVVMKHLDGSVAETAKFWFRHGVWFLVMHLSFVIVGVLAVLKVDSEWANFFTLATLLAIPLILVYRSYDALRLDVRLRRNGRGKRDAS